MPRPVAGLLSRRGAVLALALAAVGGALRSGPARAWSEEDGGRELARSYQDGRRDGRSCGTGDRHRELLAAARAELAAQGMTAAEQDAFLAALACPLCGGTLGG